jgi:hypothetical protein
MLRSYFQDDITVIYSNGLDIHNEPLPVTEVPMKAYVMWDTHLIRSIPGEKVIASPLTSRAIVYIMPERTITHADKIKIGTIKYIVLDIRPGKDFSENHQAVHIQ